ncbi:TPA: GNAT family N-acetyltransferase [Legionella anisa]|uniref:GNAT family N-acetyltransferase n=1 Tax=Legionella anisa TaxID=28082 RepID=UPI000346A7F7|nr:GNAT family N-acetyltransferase [Legionella anisa]MCW8423101.1 GNAT family N-acetyltransferase [Legionella anisa]
MKIEIIPATIIDYPVVQNLAGYYVYDRTGYMGWSCSEKGIFECIDFKHYFESQNEKAFIVKVDDDLAGFVLLDKEFLLEAVDWNMGEFFILKKFQGKGVATYVAHNILKENPGKWSVAVMPENIKAVNFWRKIISTAVMENYIEVFKTEDELKTPDNPEPYAMTIFTFHIERGTN